AASSASPCRPSLCGVSSAASAYQTGVSSCGPPAPTDTALCQSPRPNPPPCFSSFAVAHFRLGPTSSASISIVDRFSPSWVSHWLVRRRPTTTTLEPCVRDSATFSASPRHAVTLKKFVSTSFHCPVASSLALRLTATPNFTSAAPFGVYRSSGSRVRLPTITTWLSCAISLTYFLFGTVPGADGQHREG